MIEEHNVPNIARDSLVSREVDGNLLILDEENENIHQLNVTAAFVWNKCTGSQNVHSICVDFETWFSVSEDQSRKDVFRVLEDLHEKQLINFT